VQPLDELVGAAAALFIGSRPLAVLGCSDGDWGVGPFGAVPI